MSDRKIACGWHYTFGWLRRPDLDGGGLFAYEHPNGDIIESADPAHKKKIHLTAFQDAQTGERYVSPSRSSVR